MSEVLGKCFYCNEDVINNEKNDYGAFTKKWNSKMQKYVLSDYWHSHCYFKHMNSMMNKRRNNANN